MSHSGFDRFQSLQNPIEIAIESDLNAKVIQDRREKAPLWSDLPAWNQKAFLWVREP